LLKEAKDTIEENSSSDENSPKQMIVKVRESIEKWVN